MSRYFWNPFKSPDWDAAGPPNPLTSGRIKKDIASLFMEPLPAIFATPDEAKFCFVHCLVLGPPDTPYEGGLFHFVVRFGPSYPIQPPRVQLMTTGGGRVRFNPNLYSDGKVCLSILGTWNGPGWSPAQNLGTVLLSIQSLMNDNPFYNEPGYMGKDMSEKSNTYNQYLTYETIQASVCSQLEDNYNDSIDKKLMPSELAEVMKESFMNNYENYLKICKNNEKLDGSVTKNAFDSRENLFNFKLLLERLEKLKVKFSVCSITKRNIKITTPSANGTEFTEIHFKQSEDSSESASSSSEAESTNFDEIIYYNDESFEALDEEDGS